MTLIDTLSWRSMDRAALDAAYNNAAAVADSAQRLAAWAERSERLRAAHPAALDLAYGPRPRNRLDLFRSWRDGAPLFAFIHGGYWQRNAKEAFACMAQGPLALGLDVALIGYTLAPEASLTEIVAEIAAAIRWLKQQAPGHGVAARRVVVGGWSAGGHLTACAMGLPEVDAGLAISGIFELEPIRHGGLNDKLRLTEAEAATLSPIRCLPPQARPLAIAYGTGELPELQRQSRDFAAAWTAAGLPGQLLPLAGHNHFSILEELASPRGTLAAMARWLAL